MELTCTASHNEHILQVKSTFWSQKSQDTIYVKSNALNHTAF